MTRWTKHRPKAGLAALILASAVAGCAGPVAKDYVTERPALDLRQYFNGPLVAHGIATDRAGKVIQRFTVALNGSWQGDEGVLDERFSYSDGRTEQRSWRLSRQSDGRYIGRAVDVVGQAVGESAGNALNWRYTLKVPVGDTSYELQFDDWMFLIDDQTMLNRAVMSKFGVRVGEVLLSFRRL